MNKTEALRQIEVFCKETFKQPKNWSLESQKLGASSYDKNTNTFEYLYGELVLKGVIFVVYPSELLQGVFPHDIY